MSVDPKLMPQIRIPIEVTGEFLPTKKGGRMQVCWVFTGGKFPERLTMFVRGSGPSSPGEALASGIYYATRIKKSQFDFVVDTDTMAPASK